MHDIRNGVAHEQGAKFLSQKVGSLDDMDRESVDDDDGGCHQ